MELKLFIYCALFSITMSMEKFCFGFQNVGNCAHASVRNAILVANWTKQEVTESTVLAAFPVEFRSEVPVPVEVVQKALHTLGVRSSLTRFEPSIPNAKWENAILLLFADPKKPGHFVVCKKVLKNKVIVMDSNYHSRERVIPMEQLLAWWDGTAIVIKRRSFVEVLNSLASSVLLAVVAVWLWGLRKPRMRKNVVSIALTALLCVPIGCDIPNRNLDSNSFIEFETDIIRLENLVEGRNESIELKLRCLSEAVRIERIFASCKCAKVYADLEGRLLLPFSVHTFRVDLDPRQDEVVGTEIVVECNKGGKAVANLSGIVTRKLKLSVPTIYLKTSESEKRIRLALVRTKPAHFESASARMTQIEGKRVRMDLDSVDETSLGLSRVGGDLLQETQYWNVSFVRNQNDENSEVVTIPYIDGEYSVKLVYVDSDSFHGIPIKAYVGNVNSASICKLQFITAMGLDFRIDSKQGSQSQDIRLTVEQGNECQVVLIEFDAPIEKGKFVKRLDFFENLSVTKGSVSVFGEVIPGYQEIVNSNVSQ
jgi:hypothetical protein